MMKNTCMEPASCRHSLRCLLGGAYMDSVVRGACVLGGMAEREAEALASEAIDFYPESFAERVEGFLPKVGQAVTAPIESTVGGAATESFVRASNRNASPVGGIGYLRLGEDGRLYLSAKSEHFHAPLGHAFPGHRLLDNARLLGITNATHNNNRGYVTRLLETELVRVANGLEKGDGEGLRRALLSEKPHVLSRVINLETGSLACEAGIKMMLARFYKSEDHMPEPPYAGRIPVFLVMGDDGGSDTANYHGTTVLAQTLRGLWPQFAGQAESAGLYRVCPVRINDRRDFEEKLQKFNSGKFKTAGFLHEIVLMNYGGTLLTRDYLQSAYALCHGSDTPVMVDEIQTGAWYPQLFLYREYGLEPDFVVAGKGFPGGQYSASRILTTAEMDNLNQFGALVTNGQEELASLSFLITMEFARANGAHIREAGRYYHERLDALAKKRGDLIVRIDGLGLIGAICFARPEKAAAFAERLESGGVEVGLQSDKRACPPAVLTKLPLIASGAMIDLVADRMEGALEAL